MAIKMQSSGVYRATQKKNRKGIHSKNKQSKLKTSRNYNKPYNGQGR